MKKIFLLILVLLCTGCGGGKSDDGKLKIVTSFYPIYLETVNIVGDTDGVEVINLTKP